MFSSFTNKHSLQHYRGLRGEKPLHLEEFFFSLKNSFSNGRGNIQIAVDQERQINTSNYSFLIHSRQGLPYFNLKPGTHTVLCINKAGKKYFPDHITLVLNPVNIVSRTFQRYPKKKKKEKKGYYKDTYFTSYCYLDPSYISVRFLLRLFKTNYPILLLLHP